MALHPNFPAVPYIYVLYAYDAFPGGAAPQWGVAGGVSDGCPSPPGATGNGCVVTGRLSRLNVGDSSAWPLLPASEQVLVTDWFQQFPSHSTGSLGFGADGALYASAGDGASFNYADYGQTAVDAGGGRSLGPGRRAAKSGHSNQRRSGDAGRLDHPARSRTPAPRCPTIRARPIPMPTASGWSRTACATRSASRFAPAPTSSGSATSAGTSGKRSTASSTAATHSSTTSAGPVTRERASRAATTA